MVYGDCAEGGDYVGAIKQRYLYDILETHRDKISMGFRSLNKQTKTHTRVLWVGSGALYSAPLVIPFRTSVAMMRMTARPSTGNVSQRKMFVVLRVASRF